MRSPEAIVETQHQRLLQIQQRIQKTMHSRLQHNQNRLGQAIQHLDSLGPQRVLERGFALVWQGDSTVTSPKQVETGEQLRIDLADGSINVVVVSTEE